MEDITVRIEEQAISLAKYLFGEKFFEKVEEKEKNRLIEPVENIRVKIPKGFKPEFDKNRIIKKGKHRMIEVKAKVDTGALRSSIDHKLAKELGLLTEERILYYRHYRSALGSAHERPVVWLTFWLKGKKISTAVNVANREVLSSQLLIGRRDLTGFLIKN